MAGEKKTKEDLIFLYKSFLNTFSNFNLIVFYGTLLGIIRDNDFIKDDDDLDFLLNDDDCDKFVAELKNRNIVYKKFSKSKKILLIQCFFDDIGPIDVYMYSKNLEEYILIPWDGDILFKKNEIFPLHQISFYGKQCLVPNLCEQIIEQIYGDNWRIPLSKKSYLWGEITKVKTLKKIEGQI